MLLQVWLCYTVTVEGNVKTLIGESISKAGGVSFICGVEVLPMKVFVKQD